MPPLAFSHFELTVSVFRTYLFSYPRWTARESFVKVILFEEGILCSEYSRMRNYFLRHPTSETNSISELENYSRISFFKKRILNQKQDFNQKCSLWVIKIHKKRRFSNPAMFQYNKKYEWIKNSFIIILLNTCIGSEILDSSLCWWEKREKLMNQLLWLFFVIESIRVWHDVIGKCEWDVYEADEVELTEGNHE